MNPVWQFVTAVGVGFTVIMLIKIFDCLIEIIALMKKEEKMAHKGNELDGD